MSATCAACLKPIVSGQPFALSGTEVFHRSCTSSIEQSASARLRMEIQRLKGEVLRERREAAAARVTAQNHESDLQRAHARIAKLEADVHNFKEQNSIDDTTRREAVERLGRLTRLTRAQATDVEALGTEVRQLRSSLADRDQTISNLRNELLKHATDKIPVPENTDTRDATEIRFSLLEIDPP